ncbi:hypothetical protein JNUCC74_11350 [Cerasibacillus sp. JNUCC 74]|jgi:hypothetical protein|uniref:hypothetical protein n=1 Tax=Virgibacillus proomii TaxID=84407 RepID=UPI000986C925|nr:hypothetical protein [Virgibacillus proomii]
MIWVYRFFAALGLFVLVVLYVSLIGTAIFGLGGSILRTMGVDQIEMTFMPNTPIPRFLSIPVMLVVAFVLFTIAKYVKRAIEFLCIPFQ